jgi:threonine dehydrogenase-like Zn-dependent dehydrogenase
MKQVRVHGPNDARVDDVDDPRPGPRDAVVRVAACGICGTDLSYIHLGGLIGPTDEPMPLGHELAGVVETVGVDVADLAPGDRVIVHPGTNQLGRIGNGSPEGGLAPRVLIREARKGSRLFTVPPELPLEIAALAEPLAVGMNAVDKLDVTPGDGVAVLGCGPIGLACVATLADRGFTDVVAVDLSRRRRELARELGAAVALDPRTDDLWATLRELHGTRAGPATRGYVEATGAPSVITEVVNNCGPDATLSVVAVHGGDLPVNFLALLVKQLTIRGAMEYPDRFEEAIDLLVRRDLSAMITHRYPLEQFPDALALLEDSRECGKVMILTD